jgi:hypothetical protein
VGDGPGLAGGAGDGGGDGVGLEAFGILEPGSVLADLGERPGAGERASPGKRVMQVSAAPNAPALRQYSSLDGEGLAALAGDDAWSNEGLFTFLQGLRRLQQVGGDRVDIPAVDCEVRP